MVSGDLSPSSTSKFCERLLGELPLHALFGLDLGDALFRQVGRDAHLAAILIDLLLDDGFDLAEVGRQVHVEGFRELGDLRFGGAHLQLGVVFLDLLAQLDQLFVRVLDLLQVVAVGRLVHLELLLVGGQLLFGLLQLERELRRRGAIAGLQVGLGLGLELLHVRPVGRTWRVTRSTSPRYCSRPAAAFLELLDRAVVLVSHLRDRIGLPEQIRDLVDLRHERRPELVKNHGVSFDDGSTRLLLDGFPFAGVGRLGEDLALVNAVERRCEARRRCPRR